VQRSVENGLQRRFDGGIQRHHVVGESAQRHHWRQHHGCLFGGTAVAVAVRRAIFAIICGFVIRASAWRFYSNLGRKCLRG
jgi:hypothetical protein